MTQQPREWRRQRRDNFYRFEQILFRVPIFVFARTIHRKTMHAIVSGCGALSIRELDDRNFSGQFSVPPEGLAIATASRSDHRKT